MPAPVRCNQLVLNYKQLCTSRQLHLNDPNDPANPNKSKVFGDEDIFLIDDD